jgi:hypothetical protein
VHPQLRPVPCPRRSDDLRGNDPRKPDPFGKQIEAPPQFKPDNTIPPRSKLLNRFNESIMFLSALTKHHRRVKPQQSVSHRSTTVTSLSDDHALRCLINSLCQLLDNKPGGDTVTAIVPLQLVDKVELRFGSNDRKPQDLLRAKQYLTEMLHDIGALIHARSTAEVPIVTDKVLGDVIAFNRPRFKCYCIALTTNFQKCQSDCKTMWQTDPTSELIPESRLS